MQAFFNDILTQLAPPSAVHKGRVILANMHALPSIASLFGTLVAAGLKPQNIIFIAKPYSTIDAARQDLCARRIAFASASPITSPGTLLSGHQRMLTRVVPEFMAERPASTVTLLDSGGHLTQSFDAFYPEKPRYSVQLTSSGSRLFPANTPGLLDIGSDPAKKDTESPLIARTITEHIRDTIPTLPHKNICVIGTGAIGNAVTAALGATGASVRQISGLPDGGKIPPRTDIVIGATGYDQSAKLLKDIAPDRLLSLFSCASWDTEFGALLRTSRSIIDVAGQENTVRIPDSRWKVHNGGCPVNFDRSHEMAETPEGEKAIALTRGLTLAAALRPETFARHVPAVLQLYQRHYG